MAMNSRFYWLILILILGSIAMGACTAAPAPTATLAPQPTLTPEPTFSPGGFPVGDYKPDKVRDARFMHFMADGTFIVVFTDADKGSYTVNGDQITINMDSGICFNHPGTYHWEIHGDTLTFKPINDTCTDSSRADEMGSRLWIRQP